MLLKTTHEINEATMHTDKQDNTDSFGSPVLVVLSIASTMNINKITKDNIAVMSGSQLPYPMGILLMYE